MKYFNIKNNRSDISEQFYPDMSIIIGDHMLISKLYFEKNIKKH